MQFLIAVIFQIETLCTHTLPIVSKVKMRKYFKERIISKNIVGWNIQCPSLVCFVNIVFYFCLIIKQGGGV